MAATTRSTHERVQVIGCLLGTALGLLLRNLLFLLVVLFHGFRRLLPPY